jgi:hypothetical protein
MATSCDPFDVTVSGDLQAAVDRARAKVTGAGGTFTGDTKSGSFSGPSGVGTIEGKYSVSGQVVTVKVTKKPFIVPCSKIESTVRDYFKA